MCLLATFGAPGLLGISGAKRWRMRVLRRLFAVAHRWAGHEWAA
jgi:hypothetical protein